MKMQLNAGAAHRRTDPARRGGRTALFALLLLAGSGAAVAEALSPDTDAGMALERAVATQSSELFSALERAVANRTAALFAALSEQRADGQGADSITPPPYPAIAPANAPQLVKTGADPKESSS